MLRSLKAALAVVLALGAPALAPTLAVADPAAELAQVRAVLDRYADISVARADGWRPFGGDEPLMGQHWYRDGGPDYAGSDARLDFAQPSNLMYTEIGGRQVLTGAAFVVRLRHGEALPAGFTGGGDRWHVHDFEGAFEAATEDRPFLRGLGNWWLDREYRNAGDDRGRLAMVHAWAGPIPNPDGPFASHNRLLPYLELGLPAEWANGAGMAAARGLVLATPDGCERTLEGPVWIANIPGGQERALLAGCAQAADHVRAALATGDRAAVDAAARGAWQSWEGFLDAQLTPDQKRRIAAMSEHGMDHGAH
ncbi:hypothetical protein BCF33_1273 [Hasllibacter halocynthiae]|uniref:Uncharacterized protein n=1 Tax=Hasllibacter halocynthiae TaxID=595589 RepID=A0A2T0X9M5_9RHOB|nr:hypothetical protein [Hasllibacter halocynthiae]PRY95651.1 hypothetical protein BCF33_1273 [Hasllibacter halocynthiae]